jgi:hypothetical protein
MDMIYIFILISVLVGCALGAVLFYTIFKYIDNGRLPLSPMMTQVYAKFTHEDGAKALKKLLKYAAPSDILAHSDRVKGIDGTDYVVLATSLDSFGGKAGMIVYGIETVFVGQASFTEKDDLPVTLMFIPFDNPLESGLVEESIALMTTSKTSLNSAPPTPSKPAKPLAAAARTEQLSDIKKFCKSQCILDCGEGCILSKYNSKASKKTKS